MRKNRKRGFTLTEMVITILVIAILSTIAFFAGTSMINSSRDSRVTADLRSFNNAVNQMVLENPKLASVTDTTAVDTLFNTYLDKEAEITNGVSALKDPWDSNYLVTYSTEIEQPLLQMKGIVISLS